MKLHDQRTADILPEREVAEGDCKTREGRWSIEQLLQLEEREYTD